MKLNLHDAYLTGFQTKVISPEFSNLTRVKIHRLSKRRNKR